MPLFDRSGRASRHPPPGPATPCQLGRGWARCLVCACARRRRSAEPTGRRGAERNTRRPLRQQQRQRALPGQGDGGERSERRSGASAALSTSTRRLPQLPQLPQLTSGMKVCRTTTNPAWWYSALATVSRRHTASSIAPYPLACAHPTAACPKNTHRESRQRVKRLGTDGGRSAQLCSEASWCPERGQSRTASSARPAPRLKTPPKR